MNQITITTIGRDLAIPFIQDYAKRWCLPLDLEGSEKVWWWGAWDEHCLRGVVGFMRLPEMEDAFLVYGLYGDGTKNDKRALCSLVRMLDSLPSDLYGAIHVKNEPWLRVAKRRGWTVQDWEQADRAHLVHRPKVSV